MREARQAIPPAYTEWIGAHLLAHLLACKCPQNHASSREENLSGDTRPERKGGDENLSSV